MIVWTRVEDKKPLRGEWVLATYYMSGKWNFWRTRIFQWGDEKRTTQRKITHWCYINPPSDNH